LTRLVAASSLDALREPVQERPYRKVSVDCPDERKSAVMAELEATLPEHFSEAAVETEYGIRLDIPDDGWTLVRPSGTEPYIRVYAESEAVDDLVETVSELVGRTV
jgi:phosphomannomutase